MKKRVVGGDGKVIKMITESERYTNCNTSGSETKEKKEGRENEEEVGDGGMVGRGSERTRSGMLELQRGGAKLC